MIYTGSNDELLELAVHNEPCAALFGKKGNRGLTIAWFRDQASQLIIDGNERQFEANQILFLTDLNEVEVLNLGQVNYLSFNRPFYCIVDHDEEVSCRGALFYGAREAPHIKLPTQAIERFELLWRMFQLEMEHRDKLQIEMLQMMLKRYLILCTRLYKEQHPQLPNKQESDVIREFHFLVEKHFRELHTVSAYADRLNRSPKTLSNLFAKLGDETPLHIIHERKLLEAKRKLAYSDQQVQEVAFGLGFTDLQAFSRFFKHKTGITPSEFQQQAASRNM